jgi:two-component system sensor histidine kinase PilS (NtrC family)
MAKEEIKHNTSAEHTEQFANTLRSMLVLRAVIVTTLLGIALTIQAFLGLNSDSLYFIIGATYLLTLFYTVLYPTLKTSRNFIYIQLVMDAILISILVLVTGAISSNFVILFYLPILTAAVALGRSSSIFIALISSVMYAMVVLIANTHIFDLQLSFPYDIPGANTLTFTLMLQTFAMLVVASIGGYLAGLVATTAQSLRQRTSDLHELEVLTESIVKNLSSGIITTDLQGKITYANPGALALLQMKHREIVGSYIYNYLEYAKESADPIFKDLQWSREMKLIVPGNEQPLDVGVSRSYMLDEEQEPAGKLYLIDDIGEIKELRNRLVARDRLATAGEMIAAIAHEIRNPLGAISGSAQIIYQDQELKEDQLYLMNIIIKESERLSNTLNNFLTFTRPSTYSPIALDLASVTNETVDLLSHSTQITERHTITISPSPLPPLWGMLDANMFKQLIYNLLLNSARATLQDGLLNIDLQEEGDFAQLTVTDSGTGISEEDLQTMFRPFSSKMKGGTGLGLAIVYKIVEEHNGSIHVRSQKNIGTAVRILLPLRPEIKNDFNVKVESLEPWKYGDNSNS